MSDPRLVNGVVVDPSEALRAVGKENSELHEEMNRLQREHYWFMKALTYISKMPNEASAIAMKALQFRPFP